MRLGYFRFLLAFCVLVGHCLFNPYVSIPPVFAFFTISGYLMSLILHENYDSFLNFYYSRILRIYPAYWIGLLIAICFYNLIGLQFSLKASDVFLFQQYDLIHFAAWSLHHELIYYLLFPLIVRYFSLVPLWLLIAIILFYSAGDYEGSHCQYRYVSFAFALGAFSYYIKNRLSSRSIPFVYFLVCLMGLWVETDKGYSFSVALLSSLFLSLCNFKENDFSKMFGNMSYHIYIIHIPILTVIPAYLGNYHGKLEFLIFKGSPVVLLSFIVTVFTLSLIYAFTMLNFDFWIDRKRKIKLNFLNCYNYLKA